MNRTSGRCWPKRIAAGKTVALPAFVPGTNCYTARQIVDPARDLMAGKFGIREPLPSCPEVPVKPAGLGPRAWGSV